MSTIDNHDPKIVYANLMEEAKARIDVINLCINGPLPINEMFREEFAYLQLRLICEIVALSCLVAHGDLAKDDLSKFGNEYDADKILKNLEKLNPTFFPIPVKINIQPAIGNNPGNVHLEEVPEGTYLTKKEFLELYGRTGNYLHRGKFKKIETRPPYTGADMSSVIAWGQKLIKLLEQHRIGSPDNLQHWICALKDPNGNVMMAHAQAPAPGNIK